MSGWSRTTKPSADKTIPEAEIFGVDSSEIAQTDGPSHVGWVRRKEIGATRVVYETLVAMKTPPLEDSGDDTEFPGGNTTTTTTTAAPTTTTTAAPTTTTTAEPTTTTTAEPTTTTTTAG
jgi:hypothetical protein